jgi:hypothetical protein
VPGERGPCRAGRAALLVVLFAGGVAARGGDAASVAGVPRAVPVRDGRAAFRVRPEGGGPVLVVVSALAREGGPFPVSLRVEPADAAPDEAPLAAIGDAGNVPAPPALPVPAPIAAGPDGGEAASTPLPPPASRLFWLPVRPGAPADASRYVPIRGQLAAVGRRVQVYVDARDRDRVDPALAGSAVAAFDDEVWPRSAERWGTARDVDGDGRFTVLLTSWLGRIRREGEPVAGCFRGADLDVALAPPFGNRCDLVALDARLEPGPHFKTVLIHEYAHAVVFTRKVLSATGAARAAEDEAGWLDEAIAHLVEDEHAASRSNLGRRLASYREAPEAFGLVLPDGDGDGDGDAAFAGGGHRGAGTLFLRYCATRVGRAELLRRLASPGARGVANVERAVGAPFPELFRGWSVAQFVAPATLDAERPAAHAVAVGGPPRRWLARPTTAHYAIVADPGDAPVRVVVAAPPGADLQVTAVPLPATP